MAIAVVQSVSAHAATATTVTTAGITTTSGNLLVANIPTLILAGTWTSITDSKGNTWTLAIANFQTTTGTNLRQYYCENCIGGSGHTFTNTSSSASNYPSIQVMEISGYQTGSFDVSSTNTYTNAAAFTSNSTGTTAQANELLIGCVSGGTTFAETYGSAGGSWTTATNQPNLASTAQGFLVEYQRVTSGPSTYAYATPTSSANMQAVIYISTWKEATGGSSFTGTPTLGQLIKTGKVPTLTKKFFFVPAVSSLVKTGQIPTLAKGFKFAPTLGQLIKTGKIPTMVLGNRFAPTVGQLIKTGKVPTLVKSFTGTPTVGSKVLTGKIPVLSGSARFTPLPASLIKTGKAPNLRGPFIGTIGAGSIVKTGLIPTLTQTGGGATALHSWFVKAIGTKTKISVHSQVDSDTGDTP